MVATSLTAGHGRATHILRRKFGSTYAERRAIPG